MERHAISLLGKCRRSLPPDRTAAVFGTQCGPELARFVCEGHAIEELAVDAGIDDADEAAEWASRVEEAIPERHVVTILRHRIAMLEELMGSRRPTTTRGTPE